MAIWDNIDIDYTVIVSDCLLIVIHYSAIITTYGLACDKYHHILDGTTYVDDRSNNYPYYRSPMDNFNRVFHNAYTILLPIRNTAQLSYLDVANEITSIKKDVYHPNHPNS